MPLSQDILTDFGYTNFLGLIQKQLKIHVEKFLPVVKTTQISWRGRWGGGAGGMSASDMPPKECSKKSLPLCAGLPMI
jgi:hypothetical protein